MKQWLTAVVGASLLSSIALALTPPGRVKYVTRLVCGLVCALAIASPVLEIDIDKLAVSMAEYQQQAQMVTEQAEEDAKMLERTYIEEECEAYILAKATEADAAVNGVSVSARWDDEALVWYPWQAALDGPYNEALSKILEAELGIPRQRQEWSGDA